MKRFNLIIIFSLLILINGRKFLINAFFIPTHVHFYQFLNPQQQIQNKEEKSFFVKAAPCEDNKSLNDEIKESSKKNFIIFKNENYKNKDRQLTNYFDFENKKEKLEEIEDYTQTSSDHKAEIFKDRDLNKKRAILGDICQLPNLRRSAEEENLFVECVPITKEITKELGKNDIGIWKLKKCPFNTVFVPSAQICLPDKRSRLRKIIGSGSSQSSSKEDKLLNDGNKLTVRHKIDNCSSTEEFDKLYADVPLCENTNNKHRYAQRIAPCNCICICRICICAENKSPQQYQTYSNNNYYNPQLSLQQNPPNNYLNNQQFPSYSYYNNKYSSARHLHIDVYLPKSTTNMKKK